MLTNSPFTCKIQWIYHIFIHNLYKTNEFSFCRKTPLIYFIKFKYLQMIRISYSDSSFFPLLVHGTGTILPAVRKIIPIKGMKTVNFIIKSVIRKRSIVMYFCYILLLILCFVKFTCICYILLVILCFVKFTCICYILTGNLVFCRRTLQWRLVFSAQLKLFLNAIDRKMKEGYVLVPLFVKSE